MSRFLLPRLNELEAYTPGEQPRDARGWVKLNTNENPYPPSRGVMAAINADEVERLRLYSDPAASDLCGAMSEYFSLDRSQVFAGNGSDEVLAFCFMALCPNSAAFPDLSYGFYPVYAELFGVAADIVPLRSDWSISVDDYADKRGTVIIANPNAPTGLCLPLSEIERLLSANRDRLVIVDEAYCAFGGTSCVPLLKKYDNLLIVGTFSKSFCLAGARLGYALSSPEIIADINKIKFSFNPYNLNRLTLLAGTAALRDADYYRDCSARIAATRERASEALRSLGFKTTESRANFIFAQCPRGLGGGEYYLALKERGILVRHWDTPRIIDCVRITVGTDGQMDALLGATKEILEAKA